MNKFKLPKIIGHRGLKDYAPENTFSGIKKAISSGFKFIEVDVKITKDLIPVLLHDETINRTSDGFGKCIDFTYYELKKFDFGNWFSANYKNEKILTLQDALKYVSKNHIGINIELKPNKGKEIENIDAIEKIIKLYYNNLKLYISSFDILSLEYISIKLPDIPRGILFDNNTLKKFNSFNEIIDFCKKYNIFCVSFDKQIINNEIVDFFKSRALLVNVYTINDMELAKTLFSWGVDSIFTDKKELIKIN